MSKMSLFSSRAASLRSASGQACSVSCSPATEITLPRRTATFSPPVAKRIPARVQSSRSERVFTDDLQYLQRCAVPDQPLPCDLKRLLAAENRYCDSLLPELASDVDRFSALLSRLGAKQELDRQSQPPQYEHVDSYRYFSAHVSDREDPVLQRYTPGTFAGLFLFLSLILSFSIELYAILYLYFHSSSLHLIPSPCPFYLPFLSHSSSFYHLSLLSILSSHSFSFSVFFSPHTVFLSTRWHVADCSGSERRAIEVVRSSLQKRRWSIGRYRGSTDQPLSSFRCFHKRR